MGLLVGLRVVGLALAIVGLRVVGLALVNLDEGTLVGWAVDDLTKYVAVTGPQYPAESFAWI